MWLSKITMVWLVIRRIFLYVVFIPTQCMSKLYTYLVHDACRTIMCSISQRAIFVIKFDTKKVSMAVFSQYLVGVTHSVKHWGIPTVLGICVFFVISTISKSCRSGLDDMHTNTDSSHQHPSCVHATFVAEYHQICFDEGRAMELWQTGQYEKCQPWAGAEY